MVIAYTFGPQAEVGFFTSHVLMVVRVLHRHLYQNTMVSYTGVYAIVELIRSLQSLAMEVAVGLGMQVAIRGS